MIEKCVCITVEYNCALVISSKVFVCLFLFVDWKGWLLSITAWIVIGNFKMRFSSVSVDFFVLFSVFVCCCLLLANGYLLLHHLRLVTCKQDYTSCPAELRLGSRMRKTKQARCFYVDANLGNFFLKTFSIIANLI